MPTSSPAPPLSPGRIVLGIALLIFLLLVSFYTVVNSVRLDTAEIARRCAESHPEWQNYQEDIKGQIGAAPVAEWKGEPLALDVRGREVELYFRIEGPWSQYPCGVPVLLRDPLGNTLTSHTLSPPGPERSYFFTLPTENRPPWLEIHYPHQERRLPLDATGKWKSKEVIEQLQRSDTRPE